MRMYQLVLLLLLLLLCIISTQPQQEAKTDPAEVVALNAIFRLWGLTASSTWNISGNPCTGAAIDETVIDDVNFNPAIKCDCFYNKSTVCHITKLKVYALNVVGQIPRELQNLTYLTNLNIQQNYLTGSLPAFIAELTALQYLSVAINALSGIIPRELGNLNNLLSLGISTNKFVGPLPEELQNLTKLEQLYIDSCGLSGELPSTISKLKNLKFLWASDNDFTGQIPDYVGSLANLEDLISDNLASVNFSKFEGLTYLDLSFNNITGQVPPTLLNGSVISFIFLGNNSLSGNLPDTISPSLQTIDLSYNQLSGKFPSWVGMNDRHVNLVWNNLVAIDSVLPSGLNCLQKDTPCFLGFPKYSSFAVDCGSAIAITGSDKSIYESDNANLRGASYYVTNATRWGVSNTGKFMESPNGSYIVNSRNPFQNTLDPELFRTARMSPSSLRYYGIGLKNGNYNVVLQFAEIFFPDSQTWQGLGKRIFDIYIQGELKEKDFDIKKDTNGQSYIVVPRTYVVQVKRNFLEIHLFWAGKGTCCIPNQGFYGPLISALRVTYHDGNDSTDGEGTILMTSKNTSKKGLIVGVVVAASALGFVALIGAFIWRQKKRRAEAEMEELFSIVGRPDVFSYGEIKLATDSFSPNNILGRGGYGLVYKGKLLDGRMVAVKQLSETSHQGKREFMTEIATISRVQHRNLVKLHGCCIESNAPLLVYECLENGSLDRAIFGKSNLNLDWTTRFEICVGIARGLAYLHEESSVRIIHRDIKTSNVLLDSDLNPKISDFGLARHYEDEMTHLSTRVAGTLGYLAPEYAMMGHLTEKADVFAFGIVVLEIIAGRRNFDECLEEDKKYLLGWAWSLHESRHTLELLDPRLAEFDDEEAARVINVVLLCTMGLPQRRPAMSKVVSMLTEDIEMTEVAPTMRPNYLPEWQLKNGNNGFSASYFSGSSSVQQSAGSQATAPSSSSNPRLHRSSSQQALTSWSTSEIDDGR